MGLLDDFRRGRRPRPSSESQPPRPRGASGRGHSSGFLSLEEINSQLRHPAGHRVYDQMFRTDGDVRQVVQLAINPLIGGTWRVEPYGGQVATKEDIRVARAVEWALFEYMRPNLIGHLAQFLPVLVRSGFAPGEKVWGLGEFEGEKLLAPRTVGLRLPKSIVRWEGTDTELQWIEQYVPASSPADSEATAGGTVDGGHGGNVRLYARDLVYYRVGAEGDNWEGVSMLRPAYKHWFLKDKIERIDAIAQEREAVGVPIAYPPPGATRGQLDDMERILEQMRTNEQGFIVMPGMKAGHGAGDNTGWLLEILGFDKNGSGRDPAPSLQYHTNKIAAAFISEFMRLGHGQSGARATAQVQADPFLMGIEALASIVEQEVQQSLVLPFVAYNFADVKNPPKLKMSLVDSTSLSQLADYVLKLTQVGALLPDQELEDFLRARAELPPANSEAVRQRSDKEEMVRRMIVGGNPDPTPADKAGAANNPDPFGSNAKVGKHKNGKPAGSPQRRSGAPAGAAGAGKGAPRGPGKELSAAMEDTPERWFGRELHPWEHVVDLAALEDEMDDAPVLMQSACAPHVYAMAQAMPDTPPEDLAETILGGLRAHYRSGGMHVCDELGLPREDETTLDRGGHDRGDEGLAQRARLAARHIHHAMHEASTHADLTHGDDNPAHAQRAAEQAGLRAAKRAGRVHGQAALLHGRHDMALARADRVLGARYSAVLDRGTCGHCAEADDGVVRRLDDPVRLDRRPPNRHCDSTASGANQCRCIEVYEPMPKDEYGVELDASDVPNDPAKTNWVEQHGGLPPFIARIAGDLITERGMLPSRAIAAAVSRCHLWAAGGNNVSAKTQAQASAAIAQWEAMKAAAGAG